MTGPRRLDDQEQRDLILTQLDCNMLVEAAAGTGKTTSMVERMIALLRTGKCAGIRSLAAVTFTRKAAAELRSRFQVGLEKAAREARAHEKDNLEQALGRLEQCFVGTIHSFCARLLRERPVEAKVDIDFEELDEDGDSRLRDEAWDEFTARLLTVDPEGLLKDLERVGLTVESLKDNFKRFSNYPDVAGWPAPAGEEKPPDMGQTVNKVRDYIAHMEKFAGRLPREHGNDKLIAMYENLPRMVSHYEDLRPLGALAQVLELFDKNMGGGNVVQKEWAKEGIFTKKQAKQEQEGWQLFREETVQPALNIIRECRYGPVMRVMFSARKIYDELRLGRGRLNYQDLLMKAAELLRDKPHIRGYFRERFTHILVDEFQDTDPIQAEVLLLLAATDLRETDWRKCRPGQGSLFVVGDPKQSIYRFRRADIVTYDEVKRIIQRGEGKGKEGFIVHLSSNFRAVSPIIDWVNSVFEPGEPGSEGGPGAMLRFPATNSKQSPSYVALSHGKTYKNVGQSEKPLLGVFSLNVPAEHTNQAAYIAYEADFIARSIRSMIDARAMIPRTRQQIDAGKPREADAGDFMIITRTTRYLGLYGQKLQEYGVSHQVTGGSALNEVQELKLLRICLRAVVQPDDPVALLGVLRGELFGVSDRALYAFKKAGGVFSYSVGVPEKLAKEDAEIFAHAFACLKKYSQWLSRLPPISAIEKIIMDLGLMVRAGARAGGDVEAGSLAKVIEILRSMQHEKWTIAQLVEYLGRLEEIEERYDGISVRSDDKPFVRVMNLHKAKGLEAPIVFLAGPVGETHHDVEMHIDRSRGKILGFTAVYGEKRGRWGKKPLLAKPPDWETKVELEEEFLRAEALRLRYVAATRAGAALIITRLHKNKSNPWQYFAKYIPEDRTLPDFQPGQEGKKSKKAKPGRAGEAKEAAREISGRLVEVKTPTYDACRAKDYALSLARQDVDLKPTIAVDSGQFPAPAVSLQGEFGVEWGSAIHLLLQIAMENPKADLRKTAGVVLAELDLDPAHAGEAAQIVNIVAQSKIWKRAMKARRRFTEIPFQILLGATVVRGAIDLIFKEEDGWVLVDYKTDRAQGKALQSLAAKYASQLKVYTKAWEKSTGEKVKEQLLYFLHSDSLVSVAM